MFPAPRETGVGASEKGWGRTVAFSDQTHGIASLFRGFFPRENAPVDPDGRDFAWVVGVLRRAEGDVGGEGGVAE